MTTSNVLKQRLLQEKYGGFETEDFLTDIKRLEKGEPYEYVLGYTDFLGAKIDLSYRPMIPRPETAFWVKAAIAELKTRNGALRLADTYAGSGNVGLALLLNLPQATVDFTEIDPNLKLQIEKNLELNHIASNRARVFSAANLDGLTGLYDAILAVPPYVPREALPDPEMRDYEPHLAFFAQDNGHEFHQYLIAGAYNFLKPGGVLFMEADYDHNEKIRDLVTNTPWSSLEFWPDPYGATPNVVLRKA